MSLLIDRFAISAQSFPPTLMGMINRMISGILFKHVRE